MIGSSSKTSQIDSTKPWLTMRLLNSLPLVPSITAMYPSMKELYLNTKIANPILTAGLDLAENSIMAVSTPLLKQYEKVDSFASSKLEKLEEVYDEGFSSLAKKGFVQGVRAVAFPVGFTMEMTSQARHLAIELAAPRIEKAYNMANGVIDTLLPASYEEELYDDVSGLSKLQRKSPSRRLRRRLNANTLAHVPAQAFLFSQGFASELSREGSVYARMVRSQFFDRLDNTLHLLIRLESFIIGRSVSLVFHGIESGKVHLRDLLLSAVSRADSLEDRLHDAQLPKTAHLVNHVTSDLHSVIALLGLHSEEKARISSVPAPRRMFPGRRARLHEFSTSTRVSPFKGDQRMPTFFTGDDRLARVEQKEHERTPSIMLGENEVEAKLLRLQQERTPTIMVGEGFESERESSLPSSGNVSDIDEAEDVHKRGRFLHVRHAGALSSRFLRANFSRAPPPTPANSPVPFPATTPNMPLVIVTDAYKALPTIAEDGSSQEIAITINQEPLSGKHTTFHLPKIIIDKAHHAKPLGDANPFDALNDAPDPMGSPVPMEKKHAHHHHAHAHNHAGQAAL